MIQPVYPFDDPASWKDVTYQDSENNPKTVCIRIVYEVTERTIDKCGQIMLAPNIELNTWR